MQLRCRADKSFKRGVVVGTITRKHSMPMRLFDVANVQQSLRLRVGELTREELHSMLLHYHYSKKFLMLSRTLRSMNPCIAHHFYRGWLWRHVPVVCAEREAVDPFAVEFYRTLSSGLPAEVFSAAMYQPF
jgi:hypothetical protein